MEGCYPLWSSPLPALCCDAGQLHPLKGRKQNSAGIEISRNLFLAPGPGKWAHGSIRGSVFWQQRIIFQQSTSTVKRRPDSCLVPSWAVLRDWVCFGRGDAESSLSLLHIQQWKFDTGIQPEFLTVKCWHSSAGWRLVPYQPFRSLWLWWAEGRQQRQ